MRAWLNVGEAAESAGVCKDTIYTACKRNTRHLPGGAGGAVVRMPLRRKSTGLGGRWRERSPLCQPE